MNTNLLPHRVTLADGTTRIYSSALAAAAAGHTVSAPVRCAGSSHLTGHHADGSGVQAHSTGGLYPFVLFARETCIGTRWGYIVPNGNVQPAVFDYDRAVETVIEHKAAYDRKRAAQAAAATCDRCANSYRDQLHPKCGVCDGSSRFVPVTRHFEGT